MDMYSERNCISMDELQINNEMRMLWEQHVFWTRLVISGIVFNSSDLQASTDRLLRNPADFAAVLQPFYSASTMRIFQELFTSHLTLAGELVNELKAGETAKAAVTEDKWYSNANQIAGFFAEINPYWSFQEWRAMMQNHLEMTKDEAAAFLAGKYEESVAIFDRIEMEALEMADMMTEGLVEQFFMD